MAEKWLKLKKEGDKIKIFVDECAHSCGENRYEWEQIGTVSVKNLATKIYDLLNDQQSEIMF